MINYIKQTFVLPVKTQGQKKLHESLYSAENTEIQSLLAIEEGEQINSYFLF